MIGETFFKIGSLTIYTYGFFVMLAVLATSLIIYLLAQKAKLQKTVIFDLVIYTLLFGIIGARITFYVLYSDQFSSFWDIFKIWQGGLVSWGGFIFGIVAAVAVLKIYKENTLKWLDILAISSLLGLSIGRFGSFLSGELAGLSFNGLFSVSGVYPVTLYESLFLLVVFFIWLIFYLNSRLKATPGIFGLGVLATYSLGRFLIDFFRQESDIFAGISLGQLFSVMILFISIIVFMMYIISKKKGPENVIS
jgi:phosphatidylglycerol:prolipoprotein diacylglycerol transferase